MERQPDGVDPSRIHNSISASLGDKGFTVFYLNPRYTTEVHLDTGQQQIELGESSVRRRRVVVIHDDTVDVRSAQKAKAAKGDFPEDFILFLHQACKDGYNSIVQSDDHVLAIRKREPET